MPVDDLVNERFCQRVAVTIGKDLVWEEADMIAFQWYEGCNGLERIIIEVLPGFILFVFYLDQ